MGAGAGTAGGVLAEVVEAGAALVAPVEGRSDGEAAVEDDMTRNRVALSITP